MPAEPPAADPVPVSLPAPAEPARLAPESVPPPEPPLGAADVETPSEPDDESPAEELERFVTRQVEEWRPEDREKATDPARRERRRSIVLAARERAAADIAAGRPRVMTCGTVTGGRPDVDPRTGFRRFDHGCMVFRDVALETLAYNAEIEREWRAGRIRSGSFLDRFVTADQARAWLAARGVTLAAGDEGVRTPNGEGVVRIPEKPCGSWSDGVGEGGCYDIDRPSERTKRVPGWPSLMGSEARVAFREDGLVYVVAYPAHATEWTSCHVFDTATGLHLHTLDSRDRR